VGWSNITAKRCREPEPRSLSDIIEPDAYVVIGEELLMDGEKLREIRADFCYHEAAHAVFAVHAGLQIRRVYVTDELDGECVSAHPVEPYLWQGIELAAEALAGEYAVCYRHGKEIRHKPFDELIEDASWAEEEAAFGDEEAINSDDVRALRVLQRVAESPQTKAMMQQLEQQDERLRNAELPPGAPPRPDNPPWDDVEKSYEIACEEAARNVQLWWDEIQAVAEKLMEAGYLDGVECLELVEAVRNSK
jgi:hypothetical protein